MAIRDYNQERSGQRLVVYTRDYSGSQFFVKHGMEFDNILVQVYDSEKNIVYPEVVEKLNNSNLNIEMGVSGDYTVSVFKITHIISGYTETFSGDASKTFFHKLGTTDILYQCWDEDDRLVQPKRIVKTDIDCLVEFSAPFTGYINFVHAYPISKTVDELDSDWTYKYRLNKHEYSILAQCTDSAGEVFVPKTINVQKLKANLPSTNSLDVELHVEGDGNINTIIHGYRI